MTVDDDDDREDFIDFKKSTQFFFRFEMTQKKSNWRKLKKQTIQTLNIDSSFIHSFAHLESTVVVVNVETHLYSDRSKSNQKFGKWNGNSVKDAGFGRFFAHVVLSSFFDRIRWWKCPKKILKIWIFEPRIQKMIIHFVLMVFFSFNTDNWSSNDDDDYPIEFQQKCQTYRQNVCIISVIIMRIGIVNDWWFCSFTIEFLFVCV